MGKVDREAETSAKEMQTLSLEVSGLSVKLERLRGLRDGLLDSLATNNG